MHILLFLISFFFSINAYSGLERQNSLIDNAIEEYLNLQKTNGHDVPQGNMQSLVDQVHLYLNNKTLSNPVLKQELQIFERLGADMLDAVIKNRIKMRFSAELENSAWDEDEASDESYSNSSDSEKDDFEKEENQLTMELEKQIDHDEEEDDDDYNQKTHFWGSSSESDSNSDSDDSDSDDSDSDDQTAFLDRKKLSPPIVKKNPVQPATTSPGFLKIVLLPMPQNVERALSKEEEEAIERERERLEMERKEAIEKLELSKKRIKAESQRRMALEDARIEKKYARSGYILNDFVTPKPKVPSKLKKYIRIE